MRSRIFAIGALALVVGVAGCGGGGSSSATQAPNPNAAESSPPGDIPDNQAFVAYKPPGAGVQVKVPEGWARSQSGRAVTFTDKLNAIRLESAQAGSAPTTAGGQAELQQLAKTVPGFQAGKVTTVTRNAGPALLITYLGDGPKDPVTGKSAQDAFERYEFFKNGKLFVVTVSGAKGADNVDPWRTVTDSVSFL